MWSRLAEISNATVLLMATKRLAKGAGFELSFYEMPELLNAETQSRRLNRGLESLVKKNPSQFLWSYNRYKTPAGIKPQKSTPTE
jgi:KDO2-lipid IV(A) lauroyltransferase